MLALWIECFRMGLRELWRHRLRSFLTMIGMIMGVSVVIICVRRHPQGRQEHDHRRHTRYKP